MQSLPRAASTMKRTLLLAPGLLFCASLSGCIAVYQPQSNVPFLNIRGGYSEHTRGNGVWHVAFGASSPTTSETAQCYWLYRCAELALDKGFDGFEILSEIRLAAYRLPKSYPDGGARVQPASWGGIALGLLAGGGGGGGDPLNFAADIRMLKGPIAARPPRIFDAQKLKAALISHVAEPMKSRTNVKPHPHDYLRPESGLTNQAGRV